MEGSSGPRRSKLWTVPLAALALANLGFATVRAVDAVNCSRAGGGPRFSLLLPNAIRPEQGSLLEKAVVVAPSAMSFALPLAALLIGLVDLIWRRKTSRLRVWPMVLLGAGFLCMAANAMLSHVPGMSEGLLYRLTCPGVYMVIPVLAVAAGIIGLLWRRREDRPGAWMMGLFILGGACLIINAITAYVIVHWRPFFMGELPSF